MTPLYAAAEGGHLSTVEVLLAAQASVSLKDGYGQTPLMQAINNLPSFPRDQGSETGESGEKSREQANPRRTKVSSEDAKKIVRNLAAYTPKEDCERMWASAEPSIRAASEQKLETHLVFWREFLESLKECGHLAVGEASEETGSQEKSEL